MENNLLRSIWAFIQWLVLFVLLTIGSSAMWLGAQQTSRRTAKPAASISNNNTVKIEEAVDVVDNNGGDVAQQLHHQQEMQSENVQPIAQLLLLPSDAEDDVEQQLLARGDCVACSHQPPVLLPSPSSTSSGSTGSHEENSSINNMKEDIQEEDDVDDDGWCVAPKLRNRHSVHKVEKVKVQSQTTAIATATTATTNNKPHAGRREVAAYGALCLRRYTHYADQRIFNMIKHTIPDNWHSFYGTLSPKQDWREIRNMATLCCALTLAKTWDPSTKARIEKSCDRAIQELQATTNNTNSFQSFNEYRRATAAIHKEAEAMEARADLTSDHLILIPSVGPKHIMQQVIAVKSLFASSC